MAMRQMSTAYQALRPHLLLSTANDFFEKTLVNSCLLASGNNHRCSDL
jgi:hypothetical protein